MSEFKKFSNAVSARIDKMSKNELYVISADPYEVWEHYLASFPEGTNPMFRERTEHDCSCCKSFIRNMGHIVTIEGGKIGTIWDVEAPYPYDVVAAEMADYVRSFEIENIHRTPQAKHGADYTLELMDGKSHRWNHFVGTLPQRFVSNDIAAFKGSMKSVAQVFQRGLDELQSSAFETVIDLINDNALYRGKEFKKSVTQFKSLMDEYRKINDPAAKALFVWKNIDSPAARFRNTVIGTLVQDLSEGVDLEKAVASFESKVAPANYQRPKALITPRMIKDAVATLKELGLENAVERRFATIADVSVNNVLFVDNEVQDQMKDGLEGLLMEEVKPVKVDIKDPTDILVEEFMSDVVPRAKSIDLLVSNRHMGNFMSLTAPVHPDTGKLFKWANDFAWTYDGDVADSDLRQRVQAAGGRVDGVLRFSHSWNHDGKNQSLMDLHVFMPGSKGRGLSERDNEVHDNYPHGRRVGWNNRNDHLSGGVQDVDHVDPPGNKVPVENITFPHLNKMPEGKYVFKIHNWSFRHQTTSGFKAEIEFGGAVFQYELKRAMKNKEWVTLAEVTLKNGQFSIEHIMKPTSASREKWGIHTETLQRVDTLMLSPNHWDDQDVGNQHWFFILKGCKNPDKARGFYNEFLNGSVSKHRKVFEVLGDKTKCSQSDDQLSGLGFSSTRKDTATVVVKGKGLNRAYNIVF